MLINKAYKKPSAFSPLASLFFVNNNNLQKLSIESISSEIIGKKGFGLSCIPKNWTLPFFIVSGDLFYQWCNWSETERKKILFEWINRIKSAANAVGIKQDSRVIVRSSGCLEGLKERGNYYSEVGFLKEIYKPLLVCLNKLMSDSEINNKTMPLVIQKYLEPIKARGHLSNERRFCKESRDWLGEFEEHYAIKNRPFKINLRNWREIISLESKVCNNLQCDLLTKISQVLKIPATWGYGKEARMHFEWVWDGKTIYLVQADQEQITEGIDPTKIYKYQSQIRSDFIPKCLKIIDEEQAEKYYKIRNVFTYLKLNLPIIKLYALDDQNIIQDLTLGRISEYLKDDLKELVKRSLVIRMDIDTKEFNKRQLLPRTEVRNLDDALEWLIKNSKEIKKDIQKEDVAFIFHNFIPAEASAFAYAAPRERQVQIEALWGLPEGLYFNKHDKYIVDTKTPNLEKISSEDIDKFIVRERIYNKQYFVTPNQDGRWTTEMLRPPFDWRSSIRLREWINIIAYESRRISEKVNMPISIMWFIGVQKDICPRSVMPWYHEHFDPKITSRAFTNRTKTRFDKSLIISTEQDVELLSKEVEFGHSNIRRILIQPKEENLLRDKEILHRIGELTKRLNAIIVLEGGVLSHAYYQLLKTNAIVEVLHPFDDFDEEKEFNKLVRDKVPYNIENGGEIVKKTSLSGEYFLKALREKLIEESFEVMDAIDQDLIIDELADVNEIVDSILYRLGSNRKDLHARQDKKRQKAGGFKEGLILIKTEKPVPTNKGANEVTIFDENNITITTEGDKVVSRDLSCNIILPNKWSDRREHNDVYESILSISIPTVSSDWAVNTSDITLNTNLGEKIHMKVKIIGKRTGAKLQINISFFMLPKQLDLF